MKHRIRIFLILLLSLYASLTAASESMAEEFIPRPPAARDKVCFYEDANYEGRYFCRRPDQDESDLSRFLFNNKITSIRVFGNAVGEAFADPQYRGPHFAIRFSVRDLTGNYWDNRISSLIVRQKRR